MTNKQKNSEPKKRPRKNWKIELMNAKKIFAKKTKLEKAEHEVAVMKLQIDKLKMQLGIMSMFAFVATILAFALLIINFTS